MKKTKRRDQSGHASLLRWNTSCDDHSPWEYLDSSDTNRTLSIDGEFGNYGGGGYTVDLGDNTSCAERGIALLAPLSWLDRYTRAVFAEFVVYKPDVNTVVIVTINFEVVPSGGVFTSYRVFLVSTRSSDNRGARVFGEVTAVLLLILMSYLVAMAIFHDRCGYFKDLLKFLDFLLLLVGWTVVAMQNVRVGYRKLAMDRLKEYPDSFLDFYTWGSFDEITDYAFAFLDFMAIVTFSVFLKYFDRFKFITTTLSQCYHTVCHCLSIFFVFLLAYTSLCVLAFGTYAKDYKDFRTAIQTLIFFAIGGRRSNELVDSSGGAFKLIVLGSYSMVILFFLVILLGPVFIESYTETRLKRGQTVQAVDKPGFGAVVQVLMGKFLEVLGIEAEGENTSEEEDIAGFRLRSQERYINNSQFVRIRKYINSLCDEDLDEDIQFLKLALKGSSHP